MSDKPKAPTLNRREAAGLAAAAAALAATPASALTQGHMHKALAYCEAGLVELRAASGNKGGHRRIATDHLEYAIAQIKEGIAHAS